MELQEKMNLTLKRFGLKDWTVLWDPDGSEEERGATYPDTKLIIIYDRDQEAALETLTHEFLEVKIKGIINPYLATINALLRVIEKISYVEKEKAIESITPLILRKLLETEKGD